METRRAYTCDTAEAVAELRRFNFAVYKRYLHASISLTTYTLPPPPLVGEAIGAGICQVYALIKTVLESTRQPPPLAAE